MFKGAREMLRYQEKRIFCHYPEEGKKSVPFHGTPLKCDELIRFLGVNTTS